MTNEDPAKTPNSTASSDDKAPLEGSLQRSESGGSEEPLKGEYNYMHDEEKTQPQSSKGETADSGAADNKSSAASAGSSADAGHAASAVTGDIVASAPLESAADVSPSQPGSTTDGMPDEAQIAVSDDDDEEEDGDWEDLDADPAYIKGKKTRLKGIWLGLGGFGPMMIALGMGGIVDPVLERAILIVGLLMCFAGAWLVFWATLRMAMVKMQVLERIEAENEAEVASLELPVVTSTITLPTVVTAKNGDSLDKLPAPTPEPAIEVLPVPANPPVEAAAEPKRPAPTESSVDSAFIASDGTAPAKRTAQDASDDF